MYICNCIAVSILYLHKDFSKNSHNGKVFQIRNLGPIFIRSTQGQPQGPLEPRKRRPGPGPRPGPTPGPRPGPRDPGPAKQDY